MKLSSIPWSVLLALVLTSAAAAAQPARPQPAAPLDRRSLAEVVQFQLAGEDLLVATDLSPQRRVQMLEIPELPGKATALVDLRPGRDSGSIILRLTHTAEAANGQHIKTSVATTFGAVMVERLVESDAGSTLVRLVQSPVQGQMIIAREGVVQPLGADRVRFSVYIGKPQILQFELAAATFDDLRRRHPLETAEYLGPIFRDLGNEPIVRPYRLGAWQVFAEALQPPPQMQSTVRRLVPELDSSDLRQREAGDELNALGGPGAVALAALSRENLSPEQNLRVDSVIAPYFPFTPREAAARADDYGFLLLSIADGPTAEIRAAAAARLSKLTGKQIEIDREPNSDKRWADVKTLRRELQAKL